MSANEAPQRTRRLCDFPVVFLSYDEPWADRNWLDLKEHFPKAARVHGVKGLDACHKAAAAAVPGDWVVTVDADTRLAPSLSAAPVPDHLLTGDFRLDWMARNAVNGLWSGNGCVKLWPKGLIHEMRTHEAAPEDALSLDHDIAGIRRGRTVQVTMPDRAATTNPAETAFHAFRSGLRETAFLRSLAEQAVARRGEGRWQDETELMRQIEIWSSIGRQALNGRWMMYGARLGVLLPDLWPGWDLRQVNDHDALRQLWAERIAPQFQRGTAHMQAEPGWNWDRLETGLRLLSKEILNRDGPDLCEFDAGKSRLLARTSLLASPVRPARMDALGYRLMTAAKTAEDNAAACIMLEPAAVLDHAAAHLNLSRLLERMPNPDPIRAEWHLGAAAALGNDAARQLLSGRPTPVVTAAQLPQVRTERAATGTLALQLDPGVTLLPAAARHVPDASLVAGGEAVGYLSISPINGLPRPRGVRLLRADHVRTSKAGAAPDAILPIVLGLLPDPQDADAALRDGLADGLADLPPLLATLGRDHAFGEQWLLGALLARLARPLSANERRKWAAASDEVLSARTAALARELAQATGADVPLWSAQESRALKRMIPAVPSRQVWQGCAGPFLQRSDPARAMGRVLQSAATAIWGSEPPAA